MNRTLLPLLLLCATAWATITYTPGSTTCSGHPCVVAVTCATGTCAATFTNADAADLGTGAAATCSFTVGVPSVQVTNGGSNYRIATPTVVAITSTGGAPTVPASLTPIISPHDIGPVQMTLIPGAM
jgi:hypothetical protein